MARGQFGGVEVSERVVVRGSRIHRDEYAYYLVIDGVEAWGYERDQSHDPAEHRHVGEDNPTGKPWGAVSSREAVEIAWDEVSLRVGRGDLELR